MGDDKDVVLYYWAQLERILTPMAVSLLRLFQLFLCSLPDGFVCRIGGGGSAARTALMQSSTGWGDLAY